MMKIIMNIPIYDGNGIDVIWEDGAKYTINSNENGFVISANKNGLISLAKQMLYMAYNDLPIGSHIHYDSFFTKVAAEHNELIILKEDEDQSVNGSVIEP